MHALRRIGSFLREKRRAIEEISCIFPHFSLYKKRDAEYENVEEGYHFFSG
jgi:hypothetical protein